MKDVSLASHPYHPNYRKQFQLLISGAIASALMFFVGILLPLLRLAGEDWAATYGAVFFGGHYPTVLSALWWTGLVCHFVIGSCACPFLFDFMTDRRLLPQVRWLRGLSFAAILWILAELTVSPLAGDGVLSRLAGTQTLWPALITWVVYGLALEGISRLPVGKAVAGELGETKRAA